ncbi:MAG: transglutaminase-like domain-containing protein [Sedimentisphaerales bacterium]|jgi:hypothetical protein|nr:transglutaminase-like domain-containing protein [Sedimentisphaerales bacterium]
MRLFLSLFFAAVFFLSSGVVLGDEREEEYYAIFVDGKKIGHSVLNRSVTGEEVTTTQDMNMSIVRAGVSLPIVMSEKYIETAKGEPLGFETVQDMSGMGMKVSGKIMPSGKVKVVVEAMGTSQEMTIDYPEGALMLEGLDLLAKKKGLAEGTSYEVDVFSPMMLSAMKAKVRVGPLVEVDLLGRVVSLTEVKATLETPMGSLEGVDYYDEEFNSLKSVVPVAGMELEMVACDKSFALSENEVVDFLEKLILESPVALKDVGSKKSVSYYLLPKGGKELEIISDDNQRVEKGEGGRVILTVEPVKAARGVEFPYKGDEAAAVEMLKPRRYVQSDDERIAALAKEAVGDSKDAGEAVKQIESFVNTYIDEKNLSIGYASAAEVAASKEGDCSEHAVLTVALCRAVGIPARVATGVVYVDAFGGFSGGIFAGHAWAQAYVGGKWIGLDATGAPRGFGPGHITLSVGNGDPESFFGMLTSIGYFTIEKVVVED